VAARSRLPGLLRFSLRVPVLVCTEHLGAVHDVQQVWRAVAVALNRTLYNDVATEAGFSPQVPQCLQIFAVP